MRTLDTVGMAFQAIGGNKLRSFLTALGIIIGVASVVAMVNLGQSATRSVTEQIASIGSNLLYVLPGTGRRGPGGVRAEAEPFDMGDVEAIRREVPDIRVAPAATVNARVVYGGANENIPVEGTNNAYFDVRNQQVAYGRAFEGAELRSGAAVCIIGKTVVDDLYVDREPLGTTLRVDRTACRVIGVLEEKGESLGQDRDKVILMPIKAVQRRLLGDPDVVHAVYISALGQTSTRRAENEVESLMRQRRHIGPDEEDDFHVRNMQDIADALEGTTSTLTALLGAIAAVSLLVGGIGIMNIMLVSVTERTREIGIRLAVGARTRDVLIQFLVESVVLATIGGVIGLLIGLGGAYLATRQLGMPFVASPGMMVLGFSFSVLVGVVFGLFPARKAARLNPIDALRHE